MLKIMLIMKKTTHLLNFKARWLENKILCFVFLGFLLFSYKGNSQTCAVMKTDFLESFENASYGDTEPQCWTYLATSGSCWGEGYVDDLEPNNGVNHYSIYGCEDFNVTLISPETDNLGSGTKQIRFSLYLDYYYPKSFNPFIEIYSLDTNTSSATKTLIKSINLKSTISRQWVEFIVPLPTTKDDYFAFSVSGSSDSEISVLLDDIFYEDLSKCFFPLNIKVDNVTLNDATISWDASIDSGVTEYEYEIRSFGLPGSGSSGLENTGTTTDTTVSLIGLTEATKYTIYVRSICGTSKGDWGMYLVSFTTLCPIFDNFFEGFENSKYGDESPICWTYLNNLLPNFSEGYVDDYEVQTGDYSFYIYRSQGSGDFMLISPETNDLGSGMKRIRFSAYLDSASPSSINLEIYSLNNNKASATKTLIETISINNQFSWEEYKVVLPQTNDDYFAISFPIDQNNKRAYYDLYIDDIYYEDIPEPILDVKQNNNLCFGNSLGTASVSVREGLPPYTYTWSPIGGSTPDANNLPAGKYTITVEDALKRSKTSTVIITEPKNMNSGLSYKNISCNGKNDGYAEVKPEGGTPPYNVLWSTGSTDSSISNLAKGQYSIIITDANGCVQSEDFKITEPDILLTSIGSQVNVSSYQGTDGSLTVDVTGGTEPYSYLWFPTGDTTDTASNLVAGNYSVVVTDVNGCAVNHAFVVTQPIPLMIDFVSIKDVSCNGLNDGAITVNVIGDHSPYVLKWSPLGVYGNTASDLVAGVYTVIVSNSIGETITKTYEVSEPDPIKINIGSIKGVTCFGKNNGTATVSASGGTAPYTFVWSNGETTNTAQNLPPGNNLVHVTDATGCVAQQIFTIKQPIPISILEVIKNVSCNGQANGSVSVTVSGGTAPYTYSWNTGETSSSINNLSGGNYTLIITDAENCFVSKTFNVVEPAFVYPPIAVNQSFCVNAKLSDIVITGSNIKWYDAATNGNILPIGTNLVSGNVYYASQTINSCESSTRTAVQVTLFQPIPLTTIKIDVCNNTTIQDIVIDGNGFSQLRWYSNAMSTTMLHYNHLLTSGTYYVSTFINNVCESIKYPIQVNVVAAVPAPIVGTQMVCGVKTFNDISINKVPGGIINWYSSVQSITPLIGTDQILSGTYYIEQVVGSCKSGRIAVPVQVVPITSPNLTNIAVCDGTTISELNNNLTSIKYVWYNDATTQTALNETQIIKAGTFYISQEISGCISNRTKVDVVVNSRPNAPTGQQIQSFNFAATIFNLKMNQTGVEWYNSIQNANTLSNQLPSSTQLKDGETYYGIIRGVNGCPSYPTAVKVVVNLGFNELDLAYLKYYPNPIETELNIEYNEVIKGIEVYSITGQKVLSKEFNDKQIKVNLSGFSSGTYMVRIETEKASQFIKIVKR